MREREGHPSKGTGMGIGREGKIMQSLFKWTDEQRAADEARQAAGRKGACIPSQGLTSILKVIGTIYYLSLLPLKSSLYKAGETSVHFVSIVQKSFYVSCCSSA